MKLLFKWLLSATALIALSELHPGIEVANFAVALAAALVIGLLNLLLRPLLVLLTLPVTVLSLGLFVFVINAFFVLDGRRTAQRLSCRQLWRRLGRLADLFGPGHAHRLSAEAVVPAAVSPTRANWRQ